MNFLLYYVRRKRIHYFSVFITIFLLRYDFRYLLKKKMLPTCTKTQYTHIESDTGKIKHNHNRKRIFFFFFVQHPTLHCCVYFYMQKTLIAIQSANNNSILCNIQRENCWEISSFLVFRLSPSLSLSPTLNTIPVIWMANWCDKWKSVLFFIFLFRILDSLDSHSPWIPKHILTEVIHILR